MKELVLEAKKRDLSTKGEINALRQGGRVPGVVYGDKSTPQTLSVDAKQLHSLIHSERGRNALITLKMESDSHAVLIKEIQRNVITRAITHIDFHRVSLKQKVEAAVPVHVKGEAPGVKLGGGVLEHVVREVRVRCLPTEIPAVLDADVSLLQIGQAIRAKDLHAPQGVELIIDPEGIIINIVAPTILEEPAPGAAPEAATAEPEVIKKGKVEEGEEGAAPGKAGAPAAPGKPGAAAPAAGAKPAAAPGAKPEAKKPEGK